MDQARQWLDQAHVLSASDAINPSKLGSSHEIAPRALQHLKTIQRSLPDLPEDIVAVAVDDMKVITGLMKLVVVFGIHANLENEYTVPLSNRLTSNWPALTKQLDTNQLKTTLLEIHSIVSCRNDVSRLLLISPLLIDVLAAAVRVTPSIFVAILRLLPTFNVYKLLIQLQTVAKPAKLVSDTLSRQIVERKDAVRTMLELVIELSSENNDTVSLSHIDKAVLAFTQLPSNTLPITYIEALGEQLFAVLATSTKSTTDLPVLVQAAALTVDQLSTLQPKLVGKLRNMLVDPFIREASGVSFANSSGALLNLVTALHSRQSQFVNHVLTCVLPSVWLLLCTTKATDESIVTLAATCLGSDADLLAKLIAHSLLITQLNGVLQWSLRAGELPRLVHALPTKDSPSLLQQLDERTALLLKILQHVDDNVVTSTFIKLIRVNMMGTASDPSIQSQLVVAKTVETLASSPEIKQKLFSDPVEIVNFAFSIVAAKSNATVKLNKSLANLEIGDSDDEDEDDEDDEEDEEVKEKAAANMKAGGATDASEDNTLLELALSLLGGALLETAGETQKEDALSDLATPEQVSQLKTLADSPRFSKTINARADFCYELVSGTTRLKQTVDMSNNVEVRQAAMSALNEPLVPSRAYGIHLISQLVERRAITLDEAIRLFAVQLGDEDSYIYLNAIKAIENSAKTFSNDAVIELLIPYLSRRDAIDASLRAREALVRLLTPGSVHKVVEQLLTQLIQDLSAQAQKTQDPRLRLSSASLAGIIFAEFPVSVPAHIQTTAADCALGILRFETGEESTAIRRSAAVLCMEIVNAVNEDQFTNINRETVDSIILELRKVRDTTDDETLREHCSSIISAASQ